MSFSAARTARLVVIVTGCAIAAAVTARVGLSALYTATPAEMKFLPDPAHAGYETAVVVGDPAKAGIYAVQTRLPPNTRIDPHTHGEKWRVATVLSGTLHYGTGAAFDEAKLKALPPGSVVVEPEDAPHFARTGPEPVLLSIVGEGPAATAPVRKR
ncbi:MAG: cupin domain-containing protein [Burkholderiales bacterium]